MKTVDQLKEEWKQEYIANGSSERLMDIDHALYHALDCNEVVHANVTHVLEKHCEAKRNSRELAKANLETVLKGIKDELDSLSNCDFENLSEEERDLLYAVSRTVRKLEEM